MKSSNLKYMAATAVALGLAISVQAIPITGGISLAGGPITVSGPGGNDLANCTKVVSFGTVTVTAVGGSYSPVTPGWGVTTTTGFQFNPAILPVNNIWAFVFGGKTYDFNLGAVTSFSQGIDSNGLHFLTVHGTGTLQITGFENTAGSYLLTANSAAETFSFSSSNGALPDGGVTAMLLGAALSALGLIRRKLA